MSTPCGLFFDGGGKIGWACMAYDLEFTLIAKGTFSTASIAVGVWGSRLATIDRRLQALFDKYKPRRCGFEAPWMPRGNTASGNPNSARFLICIAGKIEEVASRNGLMDDEISEVATATAKLHVTGKGRWPGTTAEQKRIMIRAIEALGYDGVDEHQADAIAVGRVCIDNYLRGL